MIQKFLCWSLGHKTMFKVATERILVADTAFDRDVKHTVLRWERSKFCLRCGTLVHGEKE